MKFQYLLALTLVIFSTFAEARRPAVEDFVGVEPESYREIKPGNEIAYDFSKAQQAQVKKVQSAPGSMFSIFALFAFISLPMLIWASLKQTQTQTAQTTTPSNVTTVDFTQKKADKDEKTDKAA